MGLKLTKHWKKWWFLYAFLGLFLWVFSDPAKAEGEGGTYVVLSLGRAHFDNIDKLWHDFDITEQAGYEWTADERSGTFGVGLGRTYSWGAVELTYNDFGETNSYAGYPYDPGAPGSSPGGCVWPCTSTQWVFHRGDAQGVSLTLLPEYKLSDNFALVGIVGYTGYRARFDYVIANESGNPMAKGFSAQKGWTRYGFSPTYGAGLRIYNIVVSFTRRDPLEARNKEENGTGCWQRVDTATVSYRVEF